MSSRDVRKTEAGRDYQTDLLTKEVKRLRKTLSKQISLFDGLINGAAEPTTVKQELEKLNRDFAELSSTSSRLAKLVTKEKAQQLNDVVILEGKNVGKMENAIHDWLGARDKVHPEICGARERGESFSSHSLIHIATEDEEDMTETEKGQKQQKAQNSMGLTIELMCKHTNLDKQFRIMG